MMMNKALEKIKFSELSGFTEKQSKAHKLLKTFKFLLYGGAMGGGKSYWLRWELVYLLLRWAKQGHKKVVVGLFCENYPSLKDRHLSKIGTEFPEWLGDYHADHKEYGSSFILKPEYGSGVIAFRNLDDPSKYQSAEFAAIGIDEITKNKKEVFDFLRTRLRWPGIDDVKFLAATNPGGIGHAWVKKKWMDGKHEPEEMEADKFVYVPAKATDNPHLSQSYYDSLSGLPEEMKRAFVEGDWDIFKGQYFSEWRKDIHVVEPFKIEKRFRKFICGDYGYTKPSAVYWCFKDEDGFVYVYRELYITGKTYDALMEEIVSMTPDEEWESIDYFVWDPAIWAKKGESELSGAEMMEQKYRDLRGKYPHFYKGKNNRVIGWNQVHEFLKPIERNGKVVARLQVFKTCTELIRTLPSLVFSKTRPEDLDTDGEDHAADAIRYGLMSNPRKSEDPPEDLEPQEVRRRELAQRIHEANFGREDSNILSENYDY